MALRWCGAAFVLLPFCLAQMGASSLQSRGFLITWSADNLQVTQAGRTVFDLHKTADAHWRGILRDAAPASEATQTDRLVSVVGGILSLTESEYCDCGAPHPEGTELFRTVDLNAGTGNTGKAARLDLLFPPEDLYRALMQNELVQKALGTQHPGSFAELNRSVLNQAIESEQCQHVFSSDWLTHFAFFDVKDNMVAVRIGLIHGNDGCNGDMLQTTVWLPIPKPLESALQAAKAGTSGLLMVNAEKTFPREIRYKFQSAGKSSR